MSIQLGDFATVLRVSTRVRDLTPEQNERLRAVVRKLWTAAKAAGESQSSFGKKLGVSQTAVSGFLSGRQGAGHAMAYKAIQLAGVDAADVFGETVEIVIEDPKEAAKGVNGMLWAKAGPSARRRYEQLAAYTQTPDGQQQQHDVVWFTKRLIGFIEDEQDGVEAPSGAVLVQPAATPRLLPPAPKRRRA